MVEKVAALGSIPTAHELARFHGQILEFNVDFREGGLTDARKCLQNVLMPSRGPLKGLEATTVLQSSVPDIQRNNSARHIPAAKIHRDVVWKWRIERALSHGAAKVWKNDPANGAKKEHRPPPSKDPLAP